MSRAIRQARRLSIRGLILRCTSCRTSRRPDTHQVWNFIDANPLNTSATPGHFRDYGYLTLGLGKTFHENDGAWLVQAASCFCCRSFSG